MLIGHRAQLSFLRRSFENGRLVHAYLLVGPEAVGKKEVAAELANWVLGRKEGGTDLSQDFQIKFVERTYDEKTGKKHKDILIKQIHEVREYLSHHAFISSYKVVIIDEAENMNVEASNALLKTLEEPSEKSLIILLVSNEKNLLPTIVSRCQVVRFYPVSIHEIYEALVKKGAKRDLALEIARLSFGSPGRALELFSDPEKLTFYQNERERFWHLFNGDLSSRFSQLVDLFSSRATDHIEARDELIKILQIWLGLWRDVLAYQNGAEELMANISSQDKIKKQIKRYKPSQIIGILNKIEKAFRLLRQNINPRLIFENLILSFY